LKQNQDSTIQAQKDQIEIIEYTIQTTSDELTRLKDINSNMGSKSEKKLEHKWQKRKDMDDEIIRLTKELDILNNTRNNLFASINNDERLL